jgi:hypothetical protein
VGSVVTGEAFLASGWGGCVVNFSIDGSIIRSIVDDVIVANAFVVAFKNHARGEV